MNWLLEHLPIGVVVFVVYSIAAALKRAQVKKTEHESTHDETAEQRRVREIQERIRRIAAERQGGRVPADNPPPIRRIEYVPPPVPPPLMHANRAEIERQARLAEELRALEEAKTVVQHRAAHLRDAENARANPLAAHRALSRERMLEDLRDPQSLRRAFVLREVLSAPVGLR